MKKITDYMIMTSIHTMSIVCDNVLCHDEHCTTTTNYVSTNILYKHKVYKQQ